MSIELIIVGIVYGIIFTIGSGVSFSVLTEGKTLETSDRVALSIVLALFWPTTLLVLLGLWIADNYQSVKKVFDR